MTVLQITCQPFGIMNALRERFMIPFGLAFLLRVVLFAPKDTFVYKTLDWMTVMLATGTAMFSIFYFIMLETDKFGTLRTAFDSRPWRNRENMYLSTTLPTEAKPLRSSCPFSTKTAKGTCPICSTVTSRDGYHHGDPKALHDTVGIAMIEYGMARKASEREDNPLMGRLHLDTLINYRGNYLFGTISPSCKGCYYKTWCWNVAYRMAWQSAIVSLNAMLCTFIFGQEITIFYADLKNILLCVSAFFSVSTLCMQLKILATACVFILEHPFMDNASLPGWLDVNNTIVMGILNYFADPAAKFGVGPTKEYWHWLKETSPRAKMAKAK